MSARLISVLAAMIALLAAGLTTGTRIYYCLFLILLLMLIYALASVLWMLLTVKVSMKGARPRAERGERLMTILTVEHRALLPAGEVRVRLNAPGAGGGQQEICACLPPFSRRSFRNVVRCPHRGVYALGVTGVTATDIFSLFELSRRFRGRLAQVEVCPRAHAASPMELKAADVGPEFRSRATEDNASPSDVRKWQEGDELKKVHWKLSLRKRELMVRSFEESARPDTLIIPDLSEISALPDLRLTLEDAICEACLSAAGAQLEAGFPVRMPLQSTRPQEIAGKRAAELPGFAEALMRVTFDCPYPYEQVLMLMLQRMQRTGGAVLATSRLSSRTADIAMRMQRSGMQVRLIWVTDAPRDEALEMLERLKMYGVQVQTVNPWEEDMQAAPRERRNMRTEGDLPE